MRSDGTRNYMVKSFLRKSKIPSNQLMGHSGTSTSPILFSFLNIYACESTCIVGIFSCTFAGEPSHAKEPTMTLLSTESRLE